VTPVKVRSLRAPVAAAALVLAAATATADAQFLTRPHLEWHTLETTHFRIHHPRAMEAWTRTLAERIESVHDAVTAVVGSAPAARTDIVVDDPYNVANGIAFASIGAPVIYVWPTPPEPGLDLGAHRGWSELLAVHEFAHLAHLTRPSRNPWQRLVWRLLPENLGPIARRAPRWVTEGYATWVEGELTGSGRPYGIFRPAVLRQLALEGRLPSYGALNGSDAFLGGSMAYLAGSAYLEWLVQQRGEQSLRDLWRRMTARADRGFVAAFRGVYGESPDDLYRRFTVEVTGEALRIEDTLRAAGLVEGELLQRRNWITGRPAVSPDGEHLAIALPERERAGRLVIWSAEEEPEPERVTRARERVLERDPQDVAAISIYPRPRRALATLEPAAGRPHADPRFLRDGDHVLVTRAEPLPDGTMRPDVFIWNWRRDELRRVTHGAGVRTPDASPDGRDAVAVRCLAGSCDVVIVDLATGAVETLVRGSAFRSYARPRYSPDGSRIVVAVQERGPWRLAIIDRASGAVRELPGPADVSRYDASFLEGGDTLVAISEEGGIPNVHEVAVATGESRPLTRVLGAAMAPEPSRADAWVYYLLLHGKGLDVVRVRRDTARIRRTIVLSPERFPAAPVEPSEPVDTFAVAALSPSRTYGLGPRMHRFLPATSGSAEWLSVGATIVGTDPVGRLSWTLQGVHAEDGGWRGVALGSEWRRWRPWVGLDLFHVRHDPSRSDDALLATTGLDARYTGAMAGLRLVRQIGSRREEYRLGGSAGRLSIDGEHEARTLAFAELGARARTGNDLSLTGTLLVHGSSGRTADETWTRGVGGASLELARRGTGIALEVTGGQVTRDAPAYEQFVLGGAPPPLTDSPLLSQRVAIPALPFAARGADRFAIGRVSLSGDGLSPYWLVANVGDLSGRWNRVIGIEEDLSTEGIPLIRVPAARVLAGVGYSLDEPARKEWRWYFSAIIRP